LRRFKGDAHCPVIMIHDPLRTDPHPEGQDSGEQGQGERVAKALARAGVASRRDVERLIEAGRVAINGRTLTTPAVKVEPGDILTVDGEVVGEAEPARLFRYHKPVGLVTTHKDPQGRPTVFEALPPGLPRLISVGRLDLNSEGLLLLTNDGELARALETPKTGIVRRYRARAHGRITQDKLDTLKDGVTVDGVRYGALEAKLDKAKEGPSVANLWITVTLAEGKNREVRKVLESVGLKVNRLIRLSYGPFALGTLGVGEVEEVGPRVIREQLAEHIDPDNLPKGDRPQYYVKKSAAAKRREAGLRDQSLTREAQPEVAEARKAKPEYKSGWAKPKKKASPHRKAPPKPGPAVIGPDPVAGRQPPRGAKPQAGAGKAASFKSGGFKGSSPKGAGFKGGAKAPGSGRAGPRPSGPGGPKGSSPPRQSSGARPSGPRSGGGRGPRG
jgi:23S rRNA pseudouridine2605 synthase